MRDVAGPVFEIKAAIDAGIIPGPRVCASGALISQTSGHGDFRSVVWATQIIRRSRGTPGRARLVHSLGRRPARVAGRERAAQEGASQIKVAGGGGVISIFDPLDVAQFTAEELRAAVQPASEWETYVAVHVYTPEAMRRLEKKSFWSGTEGLYLTDHLADLLNVPNRQTEWIVKSVTKGSPGDEIGLRGVTMIVTIARQDVPLGGRHRAERAKHPVSPTNIAMIREALSRLSPGDRSRSRSRAPAVLELTGRVRCGHSAGEKRFDAVQEHLHGDHDEQHPHQALHRDQSSLPQHPVEERRRE